MPKPASQSKPNKKSRAKASPKMDPQTGKPPSTATHPDAIADAVVNTVEAQKVVQDNRSNTDAAQDGSNSTSLEEQFMKAGEKTDVKILDTNVQFAHADDIAQEVKDKIVEKLGEGAGKPAWTLEYKEGDAQSQQKVTNNTVPKNVVIL